MGAHLNHLTEAILHLAEAILMSTNNIGFYEDLTKIIFQLSSNIIKYAPYLFFCLNEVGLQSIAIIFHSLPIQPMLMNQVLICTKITEHAINLPNVYVSINFFFVQLNHRNTCLHTGFLKGTNLVSLIMRFRFELDRLKCVIC